MTEYNYKSLKAKKYNYFLISFLILLSIFYFNSINSNASSAKYSIKVYRAGIVHVYKGNKLMKKMWCSCGLDSSPTPKGTFKTSDTYRWHELIGNVYGQYCTRIHKGIMFHSVLYKEFGNKNSLIASSYNNLGHKASHGCIRLRVADAKYIYNICRKHKKTKVIISDKRLSKPKLIGTIKNVDTKDPSDK